MSKLWFCYQSSGGDPPPPPLTVSGMNHPYSKLWDWIRSRKQKAADVFQHCRRSESASIHSHSQCLLWIWLLIVRPGGNLCWCLKNAAFKSQSSFVLRAWNRMSKRTLAIIIPGTKHKSPLPPRILATLSCSQEGFWGYLFLKIVPLSAALHFALELNFKRDICKRSSSAIRMNQP